MHIRYPWPFDTPMRCIDSYVLALLLKKLLLCIIVLHRGSQVALDKHRWITAVAPFLQTGWEILSKQLAAYVLKQRRKHEEVWAAAARLTQVSFPVGEVVMRQLYSFPFCQTSSMFTLQTYHLLAISSYNVTSLSLSFSTLYHSFRVISSDQKLVNK